ncbi:unnamed protein product [Effrenium voratum]|nr:unnamed protein product [Effrenium voratum]
MRWFHVHFLCLGSRGLEAAITKSCSGSAALAQGCYSGESFGESISVRVVAAGRLELSGSGASNVACASDFSQEGQDIKVLQLCLPGGVSDFSVKYCSDQDALQLHASVAGLGTEVVLQKTGCEASSLMRRNDMR